MSSFLAKVALAVLTIHAASVFAQSVPKALVGCLDGSGNLYNLAPKGELIGQCSENHILVQLGSGNIDKISLGTVFGDGGVTGDLNIEFGPDFALPPSCPPGQVALSDDQGEWVCTPPGYIRSPNIQEKLWVIPHFEPSVASRRGVRSNSTTIKIVNPSNETAQVTCLYFNRAGEHLPGRTFTGTIGRGSSARFSCRQGFTRNDGLGIPAWMLVSSNKAVLVSAHTDSNNYSAAVGDYFKRTEAYPVDCRNPKGVEYICGIASEYSE